MTQLAFAWPHRFEVPACFWSWVEDGIVKHGHIGAHSVDVSWEWWQPWSLT